MHGRDAFPPTEESIDRLRRSGWSAGEGGFTDTSGRTVWLVDGRNGEDSLLVRASTRREAWWRAVEAAAACGMLDGWARPSGRTEVGRLDRVRTGITRLRNLNGLE